MFDNIILLNKNYIEYLITPLAPYFICDHFISTEIHPKGKKYINFDILNLNLKANNLLKNKNYYTIKKFEIVQVQVDYFDFFYQVVLPILIKRNIKIVLITSQFHFPQIQKNYKTDNLLNNENIILWISQNPIYTNKKYMAFPYGICHHDVEHYVNFIKFNKIPNNKNIKLLNQYANADNVLLPVNHIRKKYDIFGKSSGPHLNYKQFLSNILNSEFVISTSGDRDDCYRHYECIGLNAIPISNIDGGYKDIFEENMVYSNATEMINMINTNLVNYNYNPPNRDLLTIHYWRCKINEKLNIIKNSVPFHAGTSKYTISVAGTARSNLTTATGSGGKGWAITDGGGV